jgi:hypothetical protein
MFIILLIILMLVLAVLVVLDKLFISNVILSREVNGQIFVPRVSRLVKQNFKNGCDAQYHDLPT